MASDRFICGTQEEHKQLEATISSFRAQSASRKLSFQTELLCVYRFSAADALWCKPISPIRYITGRETISWGKAYAEGERTNDPNYRIDGTAVALKNFAAAEAELRSAIEAAARPWPEIPAVVVAAEHAGSWLQVAWSPDGQVNSAAAFRTASVTKTFTAATALRLVEQGRLALDVPCRGHLPATAAALLPRLVRQPDEVTLRHLMQHTAGLASNWDDPAWLQQFKSQPQHRYEALEILCYVAEHLEPVGDVGAASQYSDTGYVLVAELISAVTGHPWPSAMRELLGYQRLGLRSTWVEEREQPPVPKPLLAPSNIDGRNLWSRDPSYDNMGGGGLVSTAPDLVRFYRALLTGDVVTPASLAQMQAVVPYDGASGAGLGLFRRETALGTAWGHTGTGGFGSFAYVVPNRSITFAGSVCSLGDGYDLDQPKSAMVAAIASALVNYVD